MISGCFIIWQIALALVTNVHNKSEGRATWWAGCDAVVSHSPLSSAWRPVEEFRVLRRHIRAVMDPPDLVVVGEDEVVPTPRPGRHRRLLCPLRTGGQAVAEDRGRPGARLGLVPVRRHDRGRRDHDRLLTEHGRIVSGRSRSAPRARRAPPRRAGAGPPAARAVSVLGHGPVPRRPGHLPCRSSHATSSR